MPRAEQQVLIDAPIEHVFGVVIDYERYPEFLPELRSVTLESREDGVALVRFDVELIVRVQYTLRLIEDAPTSITWSLAEAKMIARNDGAWTLERIVESGREATRATYGLEVKLLGMIPKSVSTRLLGTALPQMLARFKTRAEALAAASKSAAPRGA